MMNLWKGISVIDDKKRDFKKNRDTDNNGALT